MRGCLVVLSPILVAQYHAPPREAFNILSYVSVLHVSMLFVVGLCLYQMLTGARPHSPLFLNQTILPFQITHWITFVKVVAELLCS